MSRNKRLQDDISAPCALMSSTRAYVVETFLFLFFVLDPQGRCPLTPLGRCPRPPRVFPNFSKIAYFLSLSSFSFNTNEFRHHFPPYIPPTAQAPQKDYPPDLV